MIALAQVPAPSGSQLAEWWDILNALAATFGAVGTVSALLVAALTYSRQVSLQRREHAALVTFDTYLDEGDRKLVLTTGNHHPHLTVRGVRVVVLMWDVGTFRAWRSEPNVMWAGREPYRPARDMDGRFTGWIGDLGPGQTVRAFIPEGNMQIAREDALGVAFIDGRGVRWLRSWDGQLDRISKLPSLVSGKRYRPEF